MRKWREVYANEMVGLLAYNDNEMPGATLRDAIDACRFGVYDFPAGGTPK